MIDSTWSEIGGREREREKKIEDFWAVWGRLKTRRGPDPTVLEEEYKTQRARSKDETVGGALLGLQGDPLRPPPSYLER